MKNSLLSFRRGDWNGFWALFADNLANMVILSGILIGTFQFPAEIVFGRILPGLGLSLLFGLGMYAWFAARLARRENRTDVTALPYGISTPVLFVYLFGVIGPVYWKTNDPLAAWRVALGAAFVGGILEALGAVTGPWLKRITPRAGMLGTLAGIALVWIAAVPAGIIFENPLVGLPALFVIMIGLVGRFRLPFGLPAGLVAIAVGVAAGFASGTVTPVFSSSGFHLPIPVLGDLIEGLKLLARHPEILAIVIPIEIYNFIETMNNVESAQAAGDTYDVKACQIVDGAGTCIAALFGAPFPTTVYIGHPAYKRLGAGTGYAIGVGVVFALAATFGIIAILRSLIPEAAVAPLLVFVGIIMTQQAFEAVPKGHGIAVAFALVPHVADLLTKQIKGALTQALGPGNWDAAFVEKLGHQQGVHFGGYEILAGGSIIVGLLWGSIAAFLVDGALGRALRFSILALALAACGVIHSSSLGWTFSSVTAGYGVLVVMLGLAAAGRLKQE